MTRWLGWGLSLTLVACTAGPCDGGGRTAPDSHWALWPEDPPAECTSGREGCTGIRSVVGVGETRLGPFSPSGNLFVYGTHCTGAACDAWAHDVRTGVSMPLAESAQFRSDPFNVYLTWALSPDESRALLAARCDQTGRCLEMRVVETGSGNGVDVAGPWWGGLLSTSSDFRFAVASRVTGMELVNLDTTETVPLSWYASHHFRPDGRCLAWLPGGGGDLTLRNLDTGVDTVADVSVSQLDGFDDTGRWLAYSQNGSLRLWDGEAGTSSPVADRVLRPRGKTSVSFSTGGTWVRYVSASGASAECGSLHLLNLSTQEDHVLGTGVCAGGATGWDAVQFQPDFSRAIFLADHDGATGLAKVRTWSRDTMQVTEVAQGAPSLAELGANCPVWFPSPDGQAAAWVLNTRDSMEGDLWLWNAGGGGARQVAWRSMYCASGKGTVAWSQDGRKVAFQGNVTRDRYAGPVLQVLDVGSGEGVDVAFAFVPFSARFTGDGSRVSFDGNMGGAVFDLVARRLTPLRGRSCIMNFTPDGQRMALAEAGRPGLHAFNAARQDSPLVLVDELFTVGQLTDADWVTSNAHLAFRTDSGIIRVAELP